MRLNLAGMPEQESLDVIRAVVDTIAPATGDLPGGVAVGSQDHVAAMVDLSFPGYVDMLAMLVNAYAAEVRAGSTFVELSPEERIRVVKAMATDESQDIRDAIDGITVFSLGGTFSEWSGYDRSTRSLTPPKAWATVWFHGPVDGHPDYRKDV